MVEGRTEQRLWLGARAVLAAAIILVSLHLTWTLFTGNAPGRALAVDANLSLTAMVLGALGLALSASSRGRLTRVLGSGRAAFAVFALALVVYMAPPLRAGSADTLPARYLPFSILRTGDFYLDEFPALAARPNAYYLRFVRGHYVSAYPVGAALAALPLYVLPALGRVDAVEPFTVELERFAAATIVAGSVALLYLAARCLTSAWPALLVTVTYAFGSSSLSISSQALWQHGPSQLALSAAFYSLLRASVDSRWAAAAGFLLAAAVVCRPSDLLLVLPLVGLVVLHHRRAAIGFGLSAAVPVGFHVWYNATYFGDVLNLPHPVLTGSWWSDDMGWALAGLLVSPARGLFVYSPIFLLSALGMVLVWRHKGNPLLRALSIGVPATVLFYSAWPVWWGGGSYGPRLLADLAPPLALLLCPVLDLRTRLLLPAVALLTAWSIFAHASGAFWQDGRWDWSPDINHHLVRLWSWSDNPLVDTVKDVVDRTMVVGGRWPSSASNPEAVRGSVEVTLAPPEATSEERLQIPVTFVNTGPALWLSSGRRGTTAIAWRWIPAPALAVQTMPLRHDVAPGEAYRTILDLQAPGTSGRYDLQIGLMLHGHASALWAYTTLPVTVTPPRGLAAFRGRACEDADRCPRVVLFTNGSRFSVGSRLTFEITVSNPRHGTDWRLLVGTLLPDGVQVAFITSSGRWSAPMSLREPDRFAVWRTIVAGTSLRQLSLLDMELSPSLPLGHYELFALLIPGALTRLSPLDVLVAARRAVEVVPPE